MRLLLFFIALSSVLPQRASADTSNPAASLLNEGRVDEAEQLLRTQLAVTPHDAVAHQLLCRVYYADERFNPAIRECEAAVSDAPANSDNQLWLGRAYGMKASEANPISAFSLARKVAAAFERAVDLDPTNVAAMRDLGEYYVNAPSIVGGGLDKARALAARMMPVSPAKAHRLLGQIAEKSGGFAASESEFKAAVDAQGSADSYVDLAQFYLGRKQFDQAAAAVQTAARLDHPRSPSAVDAAAILISEDRHLPFAEQLLREYLASPAKSDDAPAFKVRLQLGNLLSKRGDTTNARVEYSLALGLSSKYAPALRARDQAPPQTAGQMPPRATTVNAIP